MENEQPLDTRETEEQSLGSILGTFKDVEALKKSYDNLRSEFTRKSQELSKLNKLIGDKEQTPPNANESEPLKEDQLDVEKQTQKPFWESEDWQQNTEQFFKQYDLSDDEKYELAQILVQDKDISSSNSPLHSAYIKLIKKNLTNKKDVVNDETFLNNYVFNNEKVKQKIISDYVKSLKERESVPSVLPNFAANFGEQPQKTPKTLNEAKSLASKYFD